MKEKIKGDRYTMDFIVQKGGPEGVAKRTGLNRQTVRQVATGRNAPSYEFILRMMDAYADYDLKKGALQAKHASLVAAGGEGAAEESYADYTDVAEPASVSPKQTVEAQVLAAENAGLKKEIARLEETVSILRSVVGSQLGKEISGKTESVDGPTQGEQLEVELNWGMLRAEKPMLKIPFADVRPMDRTWPTPMRLRPRR